MTTTGRPSATIMLYVDLGDIVRLPIACSDAAGAKGNPTTLSVEWVKPSRGTPVVYTWDATDYDPEISHDGEGTFSVFITPDEPGVHTLYPATTGDYQSAKTIQFTVRDKPRV